MPCFKECESDSHPPLASRQTSQNVVIRTGAIRSNTAELGTALDRMVRNLEFQAPSSVEFLFATALLIVHPCISCGGRQSPLLSHREKA